MAPNTEARLKISLIDNLTLPGKRIGAAMKALQADVGRMRAMSGNLLGGLGLVGGGYLGKRGIETIVGGAMAIETAMTDVAKKTTLSTAGLEAMGKRITEISNRTPLAATEIAALVAQAGQFGIANEDLERFALLGAKASVAFDMGAEQTADALSQLKNAYGLTMDQLSDLTDAINFSADTAGASETQLIDFLLRTGATGKQFGIAAQDLAAFGATLSEVGISSERSSTGMNALMVTMGSIVKNKKARTALDAVAGKGYSKKLQKKFYESPVDAMKEFFGILKKLNKEQRANVLIDIFGKEYQDDAAAVANNIEKINDRLAEMGDSSKYVGSVQRTFDKFAATTESKLKRLSNNMRNIGNAIGASMLPGIAAFSDKLADTLGSLDERVTILDGVGARIDGFMTGLGLDVSGGTLAAFNQVYDAIFGRVQDLDRDTISMGRSFERFKEMGTSIRQFVQSIGDLTGIDGTAIKATLASLGGYGVTLGAAAIGISLAASAIGFLARSLFVLSGARAGLSVLTALAGLGGLGAVTGGAAGAAGTAAAGGSIAAVMSRLGGLKGIGMSAAGLAAVMYWLKDYQGGVWELPFLGDDEPEGERKTRPGKLPDGLGQLPESAQQARDDEASRRRSERTMGRTDTRTRQPRGEPVLHPSVMNDNLPAVPPIPTVEPKGGSWWQGVGEAFKAMTDSLTSTSSAAGQAIKTSLDVTAVPKVDTVYIDAALASSTAIAEMLKGMDALPSPKGRRAEAEVDTSLDTTAFDETLDHVQKNSAAAGAAMTRLLSITAAPVVDTASIDAAIAKSATLRRMLDGMSAAAGGGGGGGGGGPAYGGARAKGGPVQAGKAYLVGEQGPEPFVPGRSGTVLPNRALGGGVTMHNTFNISGSNAEQVAQQIVASLDRVLARSRQTAMDGRPSYEFG